MRETSSDNRASRPRKLHAANPHAANDAIARVATTDAAVSITLFANQRGNWSFSAVSKPASVGWKGIENGSWRKLDCVLNAAVSITYTGKSAITDANTSTPCFVIGASRLVIGSEETRTALDPEEHHDEEERRAEEDDGRRRGEVRRRVLERRLVDVELRHLRRVPRPTGPVRDDVDVVEDPRDHRDRLDDDVERDHAPELGDGDAPVESEEAGAVDACGLERLGRQGEQARQEEDHAEAELFPYDHAGHRPERPARLAEP